MILKCGCKTGSAVVRAEQRWKVVGIHFDSRAIRYQDKTYGVGNRVHTPINKTDSGYRYRCTACGTER